MLSPHIHCIPLSNQVQWPYYKLHIAFFPFNLRPKCKAYHEPKRFRTLEHEMLDQSITVHEVSERYNNNFSFWQCSFLCTCLILSLMLIAALNKLFTSSRSGPLNSNFSARYFASVSWIPLKMSIATFMWSRIRIRTLGQNSLIG